MAKKYNKTKLGYTSVQMLASNYRLTEMIVNKYNLAETLYSGSGCLDYSVSKEDLSLSNLLKLKNLDNALIYRGVIISVNKDGALEFCIGKQKFSMDIPAIQIKWNSRTNVSNYALYYFLSTEEGLYVLCIVNYVHFESVCLRLGGLFLSNDFTVNKIKESDILFVRKADYFGDFLHRYNLVYYRDSYEKAFKTFSLPENCRYDHIRPPFSLRQTKDGFEFGIEKGNGFNSYGNVVIGERIL